MLLINETRAKAALLEAGWPVTRHRSGLVVGEYLFAYQNTIHGVRMFDQRAIAQFLSE